MSESIDHPIDQPREWFAGRIVHPTNRHYASGIHDDATAQAAGFRGGTIAGSAHLDTFVPLALELHGQSWFESGSVSMAFTYATTDGEPTQAFISTVDSDGQRGAKIETLEGMLVGKGTVGAPAAGGLAALRKTDPANDTSHARILRSLSVGDAIAPAIDTIDGNDMAQRNQHGLITEPLDWYAGASPWGGAIVPPSAVIDAANRVVSAALMPKLPPAVGMWSALEVQFVRGPVFSDVAYTVSGTIVAINDSPKTEIVWQDLELRDIEGVVASVRIQSRFVKSTSELWKQP
jgi:hypothetical protein